MTRFLHKTLRRFRRDEDGQMVVEFALLIPILFMMFLTSVELGMWTMRQMFLDRGLDMAVRLVRLNTGTDYTHANLKTMICDFAGFIEDCEANLKLEMTPVNMRGFSGFVGAADCSDASQPVTPSRSFVHGGDHQLMLLRACVKFKPVFPTAGLGYEMAKNGDGAGMYKMVSISAFVQEPSS